MKVILLAAGRGARIAEEINGIHKCLLPLPLSDKSHTPLLVYTIKTLKKYSVNNITIVTGYQRESIEEMVLPHNVQIYFNPFYEIVNSIGSIWFCHQMLQNDDSLLILNADTFLEDSIIKEIVETSNIYNDNPLLYVDSSRKDSADVKVIYDETKNILLEYGKEIQQGSMAESTDVVLLPKTQINSFKFQLLDMLENKQFDTWWESALVNYKHITPIKIKDLSGNFWNEIDYYKDYEKILEYCKNSV